MPFITIPGILGKVFVPEESSCASKKHKCPDCFSCQWCSDDRCELCLQRKERSGTELSQK
ncbi:MAG: hypothetical protein DKM50_03000 [Candidatus Margulisiibacteriota bacterium]|nr:MAG: hypothetical protein A2X43_09895 [Candidatus Margulisbacteria bacterium GWD2_39_127]OGI04566.1 MAG: hypothetical protein A2X42_07635 [Candidatus Margulisbacteria bacterium GWF2_38_17]PZM83085.1 MAG: hypothetical protein DKM50_03000 [Candidatus Margulisiibacteriota bacterium]HAR62248.1 hypothetical protein [Candidatus Margulisiibacteriota bacterium]HCT84039.1 hypothetical protein [Candidatus Margulisiibacteriota bacterium]